MVPMATEPPPSAAPPLRALSSGESRTGGSVDTRLQSGPVWSSQTAAMEDRNWQICGRKGFCMCRRGRCFEHLVYVSTTRDFQDILRIEEEREEDLELEEKMKEEEEEEEEKVDEDKKERAKKMKLEKEDEVGEAEEQKEEEEGEKKEGCSTFCSQSLPQVVTFCGLVDLFARPRRVWPEAGEGAREKRRRVTRARRWVRNSLMGKTRMYPQGGE
ncbi:chromo domain-containing protein cec-1-like [Ornithorhynchus anatinus]|uniref:chromo domain-containing protein cec-1-like n=1 Tax=Ornithorhynchus anatinus TaxID=9258 RepID=UPI0019D42890|nr:chromo domain-containing protein cec-1-like [Ornithorhynchus anatinus]